MSERPAGYRAAPQLVWDKEIDHLDRHCRAFIGLSPWATLATADADGFPDVSPRGGESGLRRASSTTAGWRCPTGRATTASTACATCWSTRGSR